MTMAKRYQAASREEALAEWWLASGVYHFELDGEKPVYSIDTPPPTVSGRLHLGHLYSYSHADFMARFWRMQGHNVFYPMGYDDNGLPTERLVERTQGVTPASIGQEAFVRRCLDLSEETEAAYQKLWQRFGLSVDWRFTYRTIGERARAVSQWSFIDLHEKGLAYQREAPAIWCPECGTAIAQAEVDDLERATTYHTIAFVTAEEGAGAAIPVATTRPELLPACVALFVHPSDPRAPALVGRTAVTPLFGQEVPILADPAVEQGKGTGVVMCCTFGDATDVQWWYLHNLPLRQAIGADGRLLAIAEEYAGLTASEARQAMAGALEEKGLLLEQAASTQTVRTHERCDTPVETIVTKQWFIRLLDHKEALLEAGEAIRWNPPHMAARYRQWVENLGWDWCISRQRAFGVPIPAWRCEGCGETVVAELEQLPVDPRAEQPRRTCPGCRGRAFAPETDVMDTWATSSMSPQIAASLLDPAMSLPPSGAGDRLFPYALRPQAHEIIRTWAFYTIAKSHYHFGTVPWRDIALSGWGLAPAGEGKLSKSRGGGPMTPEQAMERYSADAIRYWAASTALGKDTVIDERKIEAGQKLAKKLWNVARFAQRFLDDYDVPAQPPAGLTTADRWLLSGLQRLIGRTTELFQDFDYATAKSETEQFVWTLADNYLEMAKQRLYEGGAVANGAQYVLHHALVALLKLLAPFMPFVTDAIFQSLLHTENSLHSSSWPQAIPALLNTDAERAGEALLAVATAVRRYKSDHGLGLGVPLTSLHVATGDESLRRLLHEAAPDIASVTRAAQLCVDRTLPPEAEPIRAGDDLVLGITR